MANGNAIHDWHAEILAMRAFNHVLLTECRALAENPDYDSFILQQGRAARPFEVRDGTRLYLYASEAPCMLLYFPCPSSRAYPRTCLTSYRR